MFHLAEWIGADALDLGYEMERGRQAWLESGESPLWGDIYEDTVAIYESPTAQAITILSKILMLQHWDGMD